MVYFQQENLLEDAMKQLSASELNKMSKEDVVAMVLQMQRQIVDLNEKIAVLNARHFGRSTEKLSELPGQLCAFNEAEQLTEQPLPSLPLRRLHLSLSSLSAKRSRRASVRKT